VKLFLGLLLLAAVVVQWLTQEVKVQFFELFNVGVHRDEWPGFYWIVMLLEAGLGGLLVYWYFA